MRLFLMTSDTIDFLYFIFLKFVFKKIIFKTRKKNVFCIQIFFILRNCNKLSIKNKLYQKSTKINAFEQKICISHSLVDHIIACKTNANLSHFSVIGTSNSNFELRILESLHINKKKPVLNRNIASHPLEIVK